MRRRAVETAGLGLLITAILFGLALITYAPDDPNFNSATGKAAENLLGLSGAYVAEFFLQSLGMAAGLITVVLASWSWRLVSDRAVPRFWLRLSLLFVSLILGAIVIESIPSPQFWPIITGLGGLVGDILGGILSLQARPICPLFPPFFIA